MLRPLGELSVLGPQPPDSPRLVVGVEINADRGGPCLPAIDESAGHADAIGSGIVDDRVDEHRLLGWRIPAELVGTFAITPPVVTALANEIDLFPLILTDVASPEFARLTIEAHPPDVPQAQISGFASSDATNGLSAGIL